MKRTVSTHADHADPQQAEVEALALTSQVWGALPFTVKSVDTCLLLSQRGWRVRIESFHDEDQA